MRFLQLAACLFIFPLTLSACYDDHVYKTPAHDPAPAADEVIRIPVVVHVIYATDEKNISPEKIHSQIRVLNEDFNKLNADYINTPDEFAPLVADVDIEFELASIDPMGEATDGSTRTFSTEVDGWSGISLEDVPVEELALYFTAKGGQDAWPRDKYLNIWVADLSDRLGRTGLLGYANSFDDDARMDGVVIDARAFGILPPLEDGKALGRTATHEIGHWLNLKHIFAANGSCDSSDLVDDTPTAKSQYARNPTYPQSSCDSTDITMNFMDYVNDDAMYMFTLGQKKRMRAVFSEGGGRQILYQNIATQ
ncbi:MAG: zinc metalloprotease [Pseudomonadales bacterium]|nr:zinc metalloprotease [Pseudomonadales bacterium]